MTRNLAASKGDLPHLYTVGESAKFLGVSVNTIKNRRRHCNFPAPVAQTVQGWDLWDLAQLQAVLAQRGKVKKHSENS